MRGIFNNEYFGRNSMTYRIGIDLGGTKIIGAIFDEKHKKLASIKKNTKGFQGPEVTIKRIVDLIYSLLKTSHLSVKAISSIGFGVPSSVDHLSGKMLTAPNLGWKDVNLKVAIEKEFGIFTYVENDVNAGTYGEYVMTLKKKYEHVVGIFFGTGIGGGLIINGQLFHGARGMAGEIGHMVLKPNGLLCGCGNKGCFETVASKSGILHQMKLDSKKKGNQFLKKVVKKEDALVVKSSDLKKALELGDPYITKQVAKMARYMGLGIANIINILNPQAVILGGGVMEGLKDYLWPALLKNLNKNAFPGSLETVEIRVCELGDDAVMIGASLLAEVYRG